MGQEAFLSEQIIGLSESIDDRVAALLVAGTGITLTYNDGAGTLTIAASSSGTIGGSTGSTDNAVLRADGTGGATLQSSAFVIADIATASPNNTVNHASIQATGSTTNVSASIVPKGTGAFCLAVPDGTATGGNARGANAVDLQTSRISASQVASGAQSAILGGAWNTATGQCSAVGGVASTASAFGAFAFGDSCVASGDISQSFGRYATANRYAMYAHSGWRFSASGDMQYGRFVVANRTTDATPTTMFLRFDNSTRLTVNAGEVISFVANIVGSKSDGTAIAAYIRRGVIKRISNTTSLVGTIQTIGTDIEDNASTDVAITADDTNDALQINVTGIAGETWRWVAVIDVADLGFGT